MMDYTGAVFFVEAEECEVGPASGNTPARPFVEITHQFYKYILYPEYHPQFVAPAINQATDTFLTSIPSPDTLLTFTP